MDNGRGWSRNNNSRAHPYWSPFLSKRTKSQKRAVMSFAERLKAVKTRLQHVPLTLVDESVELLGDTTLDKLTRLYESRKSGPLPAVKKVSRPPSSKRHIAVCLTIVDKLPHESIWQAWLAQQLESDCPYSANVYIQAKTPKEITSPWVQSRLIPVSFHPEWNSPEVVRAMLATADCALKHGSQWPRPLSSTNDGFDTGHSSASIAPCERIVFATEYCIPISSLRACGDALFADEKSWLHARSIPENRWEEEHCFSAVNPQVIPRAAVWKSLPGWIMLTRRHAEEILALVHRFGGYSAPLSSSSTHNNGGDLIDAFGQPGTWLAGRGVFAPEEVFFATMLSLLGYLRPLPVNHSTMQTGSCDEVLRKEVVFAEWAHRGDANPISFSELTEVLVTRMRLRGSLFGRKFKTSIPVSLWCKVVLGQESLQESMTSSQSEQPSKRIRLEA